MTAQRAPEHAITPHHRPLKPDGWHTYHVCGGILRELTLVDGVQMFCPSCGDWATLSVEPERRGDETQLPGLGSTE